MNKARILIVSFLFTLLLVGLKQDQVLADEICQQDWDPVNEVFVITCSGGGDGEGGDRGGGGGEDDECGFYTDFVLFGPAGPGMCAGALWQVDTCTHTRKLIDVYVVLPCTPASQDEHPCETFEVDPGGITCNASAWGVQARVSFPEVYLDVRPFPASLVRWPTAMRTELQPNSGSGTLSYYRVGAAHSPSGCSFNSPCVGDLANINLTLSLRPIGTTYVHIPQLGEYRTPGGGSPYCRSVNRIILAQGNPADNYCWEVPSHPAAGGGPLAGTISGLDELPGDMPVFAGYGRAPYHLFWSLSYWEYTRYSEKETRRVNGPYCDTNIPPNAFSNCTEGGIRGVRRTGWHDETITVWKYEWRSHSSGGEILPSQVQGLPPSLAADLDGNNVPDAYWNNNLTLRRMDDYDRVGTQLWGREWNWGGAIYWGVREGQAQIGWPGVP